MQKFSEDRGQKVEMRIFMDGSATSLCLHICLMTSGNEVPMCIANTVLGFDLKQNQRFSL